MIYNEIIAGKVAEFLLQIKAIKLQPSKPFTWASGWQSPIYCDNRKTLSYPKIRTFVRQQLTAAIEEKFAKPDAIVGVATGGIAQGVLVAQELNLPFAYVRSSAKGHGLQNMIEGDLQEKQRIVVVEDLVSTGGSSLKAVEALRKQGHEVVGMVAIFTYDFDVAKENFEKNQCRLITLSDYNILINTALKTDYITEKDVESLQEWRNSPSTWQPK